VSSAITSQPVVDMGATQSTSFRYIVTPYMRISALRSLMRVCCLPSYSSVRGPWQSLLCLSFIVVSVLACLLHLVPWSMKHSREHLHVLQARNSVQADDIVYLWFQSESIPPLDSHLFRRGICDHSSGDIFHCVRCKGRFHTLEELGRHA